MIRTFNGNKPIPLNSKVIIGIGDSFTQGIGAWTSETNAKYNNKIDYTIMDRTDFKEIYKYGWLGQLCENYLPDYIPINLGRLGIGNRAASSELQLNPELQFENISSGTLIFMLSGLERFDFINNSDFESSHFFAIWPTDPHNGVIHKKLWKAYKEELWNEKFGILECILSIKNAETFAKLHGLNFVITNAFEQRINKEYFLKVLGQENRHIVDSVPWNNFLYPCGQQSFINVLVALDGKPKDLAYGDFWPYYTSLPAPSEYITNCAHPTIRGYSVIADEIYRFLQSKNFIG